MNTKIIRDRVLDTRGYLQLEFPTPGNYVELLADGLITNTAPVKKINYIKYRIPFYENVDIRETRNANFIDLSPLGRNTPFKIFSNGGGRKFSLMFYITLPHLYHYIREEKGKISASNTNVDIFNREAIKNKFKINETEEGEAYSLIKRDIEQAEQAFKRELNISQPQTNFFIGFLDSISSFLGGTQQANITRTHIKALYLLWVNLLRICNVNSISDPRVGVPIVRFTYGEMYSKIPTVCSEITISPIMAAGNDIDTLLPNRIEVTMQLSEVRVGDFTEFERDRKKWDNDYGWDSVIRYGRIDANPEEITQ